MPSKKTVPKYRRQRRKGRRDQAYVEILGVRRYLGLYDSDASRDAYTAVLNELKTGGGVLPVPSDEITVTEVVSRFLTHAEEYYRRPDSESPSEVPKFGSAVGPLIKLYGRTRAARFGPLKLQAVRQAFVDKGWSRKTINHQVGRLRHVFRWATSQELIPSAVINGLETLAGLKRGRTSAPESQGVRPVPGHLVDETLKHVSPTVAAMIKLQGLTGMRPGELVRLRPCDIDLTGTVWLYRPPRHKTEHHGHQRTICIGPKGQDVLSPFLTGDAASFVFSPSQSDREHREARHKRRVIPAGRGNTVGDNRKPHPERRPGDHYTVDGYRRAITYGIKAAYSLPDDATADDVKTWKREYAWSPNQLRHAHATEVRRRFGLEGAQVALGHSRADVTQHYAERDETLAVKIAREIG